MPSTREYGDSQNRPPMKRRRERKPVSCLQCRHRKLKCDRTLPACANCVNRGDITECRYISRKSEVTEPQQARDLPEATQRKIENLERLVHTLLASQRQTEGRALDISSLTEAEVDRSPDEQDFTGSRQDRDNAEYEHSNPKTAQGPASLNNSITINASYKQCRSLDEAHWALLLNEIKDVRLHMSAQQKQYEQQNKKISQSEHCLTDEPVPSLLFGSARIARKADILAQLPSRHSCDIMVARFFSHLYPAIYVIHELTFQKQYEAFWVNRSEVSIVWISLLFAILRVVMLDYIREDDEPIEFRGKCQDLANTFRNSLTDCLILADYTQPHEFLIEALIFHLYAEYVSIRDAKSNVWVLIGMIIRLAMRMGYHQTWQPTLSATPFQAEMRRRVWAFIRQADILLSFQAGLPSMIGGDSLETSLPRNMNDDENFTEDCSTLPAALPDSTYTQVSFLIAKAKLAFAFARALEMIKYPSALRWENILEIDRGLRQVYDDVPDHYKLGTISTYSQDSFILISARFVLASIHHKSLCIVHSRFLEIAKTDHRYMYSRRVCLNSAIAILRFQVIQNQKIPVDGYLRSLTNYQTSLVIHDYLLAATIISAELCSEVSVGEVANQQLQPGVPTRTEMIQALDTSARIFGQMRDKSMEAYKAADVLGMLVRKLDVTEQSTMRSRREAPTGTKRTRLSSESQSGIPSFSRQQELLRSASGPTGGIPFGNSNIELSSGPGNPAYSQSFTFPDFRRHSHEEFNMQTPQSLDFAQMDSGPGAFKAHGNDTNGLSGSFSGTHPPVEAPVTWPGPEDIRYLTHARVGNDDSASTPHELDNLLPFSTGLNLSDPMSTLWNLNAYAQGGTDMS